MVYGVRGILTSVAAADDRRMAGYTTRNAPTDNKSERSAVSSDARIAAEQQKSDISVIRNILDVVLIVLSSAVHIINISGCRPNEPVNPYADPSIPEAIGNSVEKAGGFRDARGYVKGAEVYMKTSSHDGGLYIIMNSQISGQLSFSYSGSSTKDVSIQFIQKYDASTNPTGDNILSSEKIKPLEQPNSASLEVPDGTDKIVIMQIGSGESEILMTNTLIESGK
jgi:hypothetical protein